MIKLLKELKLIEKDDDFYKIRALSTFVEGKSAVSKIIVNKDEWLDKEI